MDLMLVDSKADRGAGGDGMANKSNPIFRAWAEPNNRGPGFIALWIAPGLVADIVRPDGKTPAIFSTELEAELAGWRRMAEVLNGPRIRANRDQGKKERYQRLTGPEFAEQLRAAGITPTFLAFIYSTSPHRVLTWLDGAEDIPHPIRVLLALFQADERNIDIAERVTEAITTERKPRRRDTG
ncbi:MULTISPECIES: hypothetical protein [Mesorhizobium]|uniref:hypothetical protein n=1 Tax=Mesorhizobium TaxID=68287 RepID=UPI0007A940B5|nr:MULTISPECIES: hypothetical protein [Mesorhizobium]AMX93693.1 hypothetical protein A4R28_11575 [Mesorhizobium ciceri]MDF3208391.1 hypothetical protein [Mesorhizobium sp. LMG15046]MDF3229038.1 hypothetical protein [Mesorhizobium sp. DSM 30133]RUU22154.1 hypothetical protein EOC84_03320 [Mesorhizobium sp. Primo-B]RUU37936.1 hypothetical protein EOC83_16895 [Mesorhizobium sp. Primo-A]